MPSQPSLQTCRNTDAPSASICSLNSTDWGQELVEPRVALFKRRRTQVVAVQFEQVEPIQYDLAVERSRPCTNPMTDRARPGDAVILSGTLG